MLTLTAADLRNFQGYRVRQMNTPHIYLILDEQRRHIPNPTTYHHLFGDNNNVHEVLDLSAAPEGTPLTDGAILARPDNAPHIYLVSNGEKRHVTSPSVMAKFGFDGVIRVVDHVLLETITTGKDIN